MIFLSTDKTSQDSENHSSDTLARKSRPSLDTKKQADPDKVTVRTQAPSSLPDAQWHRSKTARFSQS